MSAFTVLPVATPLAQTGTTVQAKPYKPSKSKGVHLSGGEGTALAVIGLILLIVVILIIVSRHRGRR